jgi:putative glycosyltransferase (TIGR04372 family)
MDLLLIRHAKFFVGTTSGLTNIAISFDVPCALVNCITTDAQLWSSKVRFVLKKIIVDNNRVLNQSELTSSPWRWRVFDAGVLTRYNARIEDNTVEEILEAVTEIEHFANGKLEHEADKDDQWVVKWRSILSLPYYYGAARPARYCVHQQGSIYLK